MERERPIALIIEDDVAKLRTRRKLFADGGFQPIEAASVAEAFRQFRSTPTVDLVVADINLNASEPTDRSGVKVVKDITTQRPGLPVVGLSGRVNELTDDEKEGFTELVLKGGWRKKEIKGQLERWRKHALDYRRGRTEAARDQLAAMRRQHVPAPDVELIRGFLPGTHLATEEDVATPDEILRSAGWRLRLVEAGWRPRGRASGSAGTARTWGVVPFWIREEVGVTIALLHGHPCIYSDSAGEEDAVEGALTLMYGYHRQFKNAVGEALGPEMEALREYLQRIFGTGQDDANHEGGR